MRKWETEKRGNEEMNWKWSSFDLRLETKRLTNCLDLRASYTIQARHLKYTWSGIDSSLPAHRGTDGDTPPGNDDPASSSVMVPLARILSQIYGQVGL